MSLVGKIHRPTVGEALSRATSIEEIIIDTVCEMLGKGQSEVSEAFDKSSCKKNVYNIKSDYNLNDPTLLVADFLRECKDTLGWAI